MPATSDTLSLTPMLANASPAKTPESERVQQQRLQENLRRIEDWARRVAATLADHESRITTLEP